MSKITTLKGEHEGTMLECLEWQAEMQGAMPELNGVDISDIEISFADDPHRTPECLTPEQAQRVIERRIRDC